MNVTIKMTSKPVEKPTAKQGKKPFEVNIRAVYGIQAIGGDHACLEKMCFFNMPTPITEMNFASTAKQLRDASKLLAEERSMSAAVKGNDEICIMANLPQCI